MRRFAVFTAFTAVVLVGCQSTPTPSAVDNQPAPLPNDASVTPPSEDVAPEFAAYSGVWNGQWGTSLDTKLVVETINPPSADVIYAWGTNQNIEEAGWLRRTGHFDNGQLIVDLNPGVQVVYEMGSNGTLSAEYTDDRRNWNSTAVLSRSPSTLP